MITQSHWASILVKDLSPVFAHYYNGTHGMFKGRRYRRGKNRCKTCGATNDAAPLTTQDTILGMLSKKMFAEPA